MKKLLLPPIDVVYFQGEVLQPSPGQDHTQGYEQVTPNPIQKGRSS